MAALIGNVNRDLIVMMGRSSLLMGCNTVAINSKRFVRALRRKPVAVVYPDGQRETLIKSNLTADKTKQYKHVATLKQDLENAARRQARQTASVTGQTTGDSRRDTRGFKPPSVKDQLGGLRFENAHPGDKRLAKVASIARSRAFREQHGKVLLEGRRLICDALSAGATPHTLFFSRAEELCRLPLRELHHASLVKVKFEDIKIWSDLVTPQGVIAIFSKPDPSSLTFPRGLPHQSVPLSLICDGVRDPGTLGTLLRCAAAAGCERALLTKGCVDAWEPKVLRAAMGAHFRLPVLAGLDWDDVVECLPTPLSVHTVDKGGTAAGVAPGNVPETGDAARVCSETESGQEHWEEYVESDSDDEELSLPHLEPKVYHESWAQGNTALVIDGDAHRQNLEALQLAEETGGYRIVIPTAPGAEHLNPATAASVLLFEGRRQLLRLVQESRGRTSTVVHQKVSPV